jgi:hypothetical protein
MAGNSIEWAPKARGRLAGLFEALEGFTSSYGQVTILDKIIVSGNAAATAANILAHERLYWVGSVLSLFGVAFHILWIFMFYFLFEPVNRRLSLLAAFVGIVVCGLQALAAFLYLAPLLILKGATTWSAFTPAQVQDLAMLFLKLNGYAFQVDLVFFGIWCMITGRLIFKSTFLPRILGVLLMIDGFGWTLYMVPPFGVMLFPAVATASAAAEIPLQLWLLIMGVNNERWREQAAAKAESS